MSDVQQRIAELVKSNEVMLFMKGSRHQPQCGFSARVVDILDEYLGDYRTFDVLADPAVREGVKQFSSWPTIPQLYVNGKFVGGSDIVGEMNESGELATVLGAARAEVPVPEIFLSDAALAALQQFHEGDGALCVRLEVSPQWQYGMDFDQPRKGDIVVEGEGWSFAMNRASARKVDGLKVDFIEGPGGSGFKIDNPNEPPSVQILHVDELKRWMDAGKPFELFDDRTAPERASAAIQPSTFLDESGVAFLKELDRNTPIVFYCRTGNRSAYTANDAISLGFTQVYNLAGGISAWAQEIDPEVGTVL